MTSEPPLDPDVGTPLPNLDASVGVETRRQEQAIAQRLFGAATSAEPVRVGRFTITRRLGAGGMGEVYLAHDPQLDRPVALKLLRKELRDSTRARMLREGRSLARLDHPSVVPVYDVGVEDGRVFVAMGYVHGQTLREWMSAHPCRSRADVDQTIARFCRAGAGLAHAHGEGMVHRDFKPDNALVAEDGGVRVVDFGLAAPTPETRAGDPTFDLDREQRTLTSDEGRGSSVSRLTDDGEIVGTPAYMSPEQLLAQPADPRSDQYSFCVSLYEALHGRRPYDGPTIAQLRALVLLGERPPVPNPAVPRFVNEALLRGLSREPAERFEHMEALLARLTDDPAVRRRRWIIRAAVGLGVAGSVGVAYVSGRAEDAVDACPSPAVLLEGVWDDARRQAVRGVLLDGDEPYREPTWATVQQRLDDYGSQWAEQRRDSCLATRVRAEQSERLFDQRQGCFADRERALRAAVDVLSDGDAAVVRRAVGMVDSLPPLLTCAWSPSFVSPAPVPEEPPLAVEVEAVRERMAHAEAVGRAGRYREGRALAREIAADAESIDYPPLQVELEGMLAAAAFREADYEEAAQRLEGGFWSALAAGHDRQLATFAVRAFDLSIRRSDATDTAQWERRARASLTRIDGDASLESLLEAALGSLATHQSRDAEALEHKRRSLELIRAAEEPDRMFAAEMVSSYAATVMRLGDYKEAIARYHEAIETLEQLVGASHPAVADVRSNLGVALLTDGDVAGAREQLMAAQKLHRAAHPGGHPGLATTLAVLGYIERERGDLESAAGLLDEALAIFRERLGPGHPRVGQTLHALGLVRLSQGRYDGVRALVKEAHDNYAAHGGGDGVKLADLETLRGEAALAEGDHATARAAFTAGMEHRIAQLGPDTVWVDKDLRALARAHSAAGDVSQARASMDQAIERRGKHYGVDDVKVAPLWRERGDIERAHALDADAIASYTRCIEILGKGGNANVSDLAYAHLGRALSGRRVGAEAPEDLRAAQRYAAELPDDQALAAAVAAAVEGGP